MKATIGTIIIGIMLMVFSVEKKAGPLEDINAIKEQKVRMRTIEASVLYPDNEEKQREYVAEYSTYSARSCAFH